MSKAKFTQGPWSEYFGSGNIIEVHNSDGLEVINWQGFDGNGNFSNLEIEANAQLIAAAPEMYEMIERLTKISSEDAKLYLENSSDLIDLLAKARGE